MVKSSGVYEGNLRCRLTHGPSGDEILTDAPVDNMGKGEAFSPTDLVAAALGSCMMTVMGIAAQKHNINLTGTVFEIDKTMITAPVRRIGKIEVQFKMPRGVESAKRKMLETAAHSCPVHKSFHPEMEITVGFCYPD